MIDFVSCYLTWGEKNKNMTSKFSDIRGVTAFCIFGIGVLFGVIAIALYSIDFVSLDNNNSSIKMSYADFIAILLTGISLLVTLFGVIIAIFAFIGYATINNTVHSLSRETASDVVNNSLKEDGDLNKMVKKSLEPGGSLYEVFENATERFKYRGTGIEESSSVETGDDDSSELDR
ncbi:hypothetical protein [Phyllobacterium ifriqiyense]|uniref:hypothetical protein n=1 Tax=Phyllobacterium ifriqiyense TaxID=314238 RepID=UPI00339ACB13